MAGRKVVLRGGQGKPRSIRDSEANGPKASVGRGSRVCSSTISSDFPHFSLGGLPSRHAGFTYSCPRAQPYTADTKHGENSVALLPY